MNEKKFNVYLWPGSGYCLDLFEEEAFCEEQALGKAVAEILANNWTSYYIEEYEDFFAEELADKTRPVLGWGDALCLFLAVYFALTGWKNFLREVIKP